MAIDIRATVSCSLGPVISGNLNDDYIQGSGLIRTRGSILLNGTFTPAAGTIVTFSYVKAGVTRSIPRKVRVLSSFADPFRGTTQVELGCKLTYLEDLQEPERITITPQGDTRNNAFSTEDYSFVSPPIHAQSVMDTCLSKLGITASSSPLTNKFTIASFNFSGSYVQILSDLLVSECYVGYLDTNEVLQIINLRVDGGTGPVLNQSSIIELGSIGIGDKYSDNVAVSYRSLRLKEAINSGDQIYTGLGIGETATAEEYLSRARWEISKTSGSLSTIRIDYEDPVTGENNTKIHTYLPYSETASLYNDDDQIIAEATVTDTSDAAIAGNYFSEALSLGYDFTPAYRLEYERTTYNYSNGFGYEEILKTTETVQSLARIAGSINMDFFYDDNNDNVFTPIYVGFGESIITELVIETSLVTNTHRKTSTSTYRHWAFTPEGQQAIARGAESIASFSQAQNFYEAICQSGLQYVGTNVQSSHTQSASGYGQIVPGNGSRQKQSRPSSSSLLIESYSKQSSGSHQEESFQSTGELVMISGDPVAEHRIVLSMPYAPDDFFSLYGASYTRTSSDAYSKAMNFGRVQNKLLFGNRYGMGLQIAPEVLPVAPFSPLFVQANGLTAMYRVNGSGWTFDSNGIIASVDALFWGGVGTS